MEQLTRVLPSRSGGPAHRVIYAGTVVASCITCEAARHGNDCWAALQEKALTSTTVDPRQFQETQPPIHPDNDRALVALKLTGSSQWEMEARMDMILSQQSVMKQFFTRVMERGVD